MQWPKPAYRIKTMWELIRRKNFKPCLGYRVPQLVILLHMGSLLWIIQKKIFIHRFLSFEIPYFSKDKSLIRKRRFYHEIILPKNMRLSFQKNRENFWYKTEQLSMMGRYATLTVLTLFLLFSASFTDLIIGEEASTPLSDPLFVLQVVIFPKN